MTGPLEGIAVVDLSRAMAGPYCTALLADMGATVIKVESLNGGDTARQWPPFEGDHSLYFDSVNRNKRSICVDFYGPEGREVLDRLIAGADVLVENFKPGTLDQMGLTREHLADLNPTLVLGSVNGFGLTGPMKDDAGLDQVIQGMSGLISVTGSEAGDTYRVGVPIVDITSGMICAFGIVAALLGRRSGHPVGRVSTSLLETALSLSVFQGQRALSLGQTPLPQGNNHPTIAPYGMFTTATEPLTVAVGSDKQWRAFCALLDLPLLADDPRFTTGAARSARRDELKAVVEEALGARTAEEWVPIITAAGIPCGPIYDYTQAFATEQVAALQLVQHGRRQDGSDLPVLRGPLSVDGDAAAVRRMPPALGEHTAEVLRELGYSADAVERLAAAGRGADEPGARVTAPTRAPGSAGRISATVADGVATVVIDDPARRNAMTAAMCIDLAERMPRLDVDPEVVLVTLRGAGAVFSAGAAIDELSDVLMDHQDDGSRIDHLSRADHAIASMSKPTIALVDGACMGGGWQIASACDFIVASARSVFAITPAKIGVIYPRAGIERLVRQVGPATAKFLLLTGTTVSAAEARDLGLATTVVPDDGFAAYCDALTSTLSRNSRFSMHTLKSLVGSTVTSAAQLDDEWEQAWDAMTAGPDMTIGVDAFLHRERPRFTWTPES